jgi:DNA-binding IclR family transcriptional regulator
MTLIACLADADGPVSVRHVADELGLAPSTTHRLLNLMVEGGFAQYESRGQAYGIGPEFYRVAHRLAARTTPAQVARGVITDLAERYDETVLYGMVLMPEGRIAFMERADGQKRLLYRIDMQTPLSLVWGASGKAALAYLPEADIARILAVEGASPATGAELPDTAAMAEELARIRADGYCISHGEKLPDALGIAAPVFGPGRVIGTICMTMPKTRAPEIPVRALGTEVAATAAHLTAQLGGHAP